MNDRSSEGKARVDPRASCGIRARPASPGGPSPAKPLAPAAAGAHPQAKHRHNRIACDEPIVAGALRFIREQACRGIKVSDVAEAVGTTRHVLAGRFLKLTGHSPHEEIVRVQFRQVETLLIDTDLSLAEIAARTGFRHAEYITVAFTRRYGRPRGYSRPRQRRRPAKQRQPRRQSPTSKT